MRGARLLLAVVAALAAGACARQQPAYYVMDPNTGQPVPVVSQQSYASPDYAQQPATQSYAQSGGRGLFGSSSEAAQQSYAQQSYAQQPAPVQYVQQPQQTVYRQAPQVVYMQPPPPRVVYMQPPPPRVVYGYPPPGYRYGPY